MDDVMMPLNPNAADWYASKDTWCISMSDVIKYVFDLNILPLSNNSCI